MLLYRAAWRLASALCVDCCKELIMKAVPWLYMAALTAPCSSLPCLLSLCYCLQQQSCVTKRRNSH
jgi:hypothetical protein